MKRDIHFRTGDENLIKWLASKTNQSDTIEEILIKYKNGDLVELVDSKAKEEQQIAKLKAQVARLNKQNLSIDLQNWSTLGSLKVPQELRIELINGSKSLSALNDYNKELKERPQFDENWLCYFCNHIHFSTGSHQCSASNCNCGIRG